MTPEELNEIIYDLTDEQTSVEYYLKISKGKFCDENYSMKLDTLAGVEGDDYKITVSPYNKKELESAIILEGLKNIVSRIENIGGYDVDLDIKIFLKEKTPHN